MPLCVFGLGNPESSYARTRHNAGVWFIEALAHQLRVRLAPLSGYSLIGANAPPTLLISKKNMNLSGEALAPYTHYHRIAPEQVLVVHDELDLPPGGLRLKRGGGHAGHRGLKSLMQSLGSDDFWRLRIGIGHPRNEGWSQEVADFVLTAPSREHQAAINTAIAKALDAWPLLEDGRYKKAMDQLHTAPSPQQTPQ